jgi:hypothetical protein
MSENGFPLLTVQLAEIPALAGLTEVFSPLIESSNPLQLSHNNGLS